MPTSLQIFLRRFEVCFSTYVEQLNDALVDHRRNPFKIRSQSILYVNDEWQGFLDIIQLMNCRTECDIPLELRDTLQVTFMRFVIVFHFHKLFVVFFSDTVEKQRTSPCIASAMQRVDNEKC